MAESISADQVKKIVFACDAGMGSSLIGANQLKKKLRKAGLKVEVVNKPVHSIPGDAQIVLVHKGLVNLACQKAPWAVIIAFNNFVNNPVYDRLVDDLKTGINIESTE